MAQATNIVNFSKFGSLDNVSEREITKRFGKPEDYIELFINDESGNQLSYIDNFKSYTLPAQGAPGNDTGTLSNPSLSSIINVDPVQVLAENGYIAGRYTLLFNLHRRKVFNSFQKLFTIEEISPSRTEIRVLPIKAEERRI